MKEANEQRDEVKHEQERKRELRSIPTTTLYAELTSILRQAQHASGTANAVLRIVRSMREHYRNIQSEPNSSNASSGGRSTESSRSTAQATPIQRLIAFHEPSADAHPLHDQLALYGNREIDAVSQTIGLQYGSTPSPYFNGEALFREIFKLLIMLYEDCELFDAEFFTWDIGRRGTIECLEYIANKLSEERKGVLATRLGGAVGGIVSAGLSIAGIALIPVTFGGSLGLTVAGVTLGVAAGGAGVGAGIRDRVVKKNETKEMKAIIEEEYERTRNILRLMTRMIKHHDEIRKLITQLQHMSNVSSNAGLASVRNPNLIVGGNVFVNTARWMRTIGNIANIIDEPLRVIGNAARVAGRVAGIALIGVLAAIDVVEVIYTSKKIHEGSVSKLATRIREKVIVDLRSEQDVIDAFRREWTTGEQQLCLAFEVKQNDDEDQPDCE